MLSSKCTGIACSSCTDPPRRPLIPTASHISPVVACLFTGEHLFCLYCTASEPLGQEEISHFSHPSADRRLGRLHFVQRAHHPPPVLQFITEHLTGLPALRTPIPISLCSSLLSPRTTAISSIILHTRPWPRLALLGGIHRCTACPCTLFPTTCVHPIIHFD